MTTLRVLTLAAALLSAADVARAQSGGLSPNAPPDRPKGVGASCLMDAMNQAMAPYVEQARASWPAARERFRAGLPAGHSFYVTTRLRDSTGRTEQVFVAVDSVARDTIYGRIASDIMVVRGYHSGQRHHFPESELVDWMVANPDGSEEGNVVGKFLDTYTPPKSCS